MAPSPELILALEAGEPDERILFMEPRERYDQCIVGVADRFHSRFLVYDKECVLRVIVEDGAPYDDDVDPETDALEHFEFNIVGGWVGDGTPAFLTTDPEKL